MSQSTLPESSDKSVENNSPSNNISLIQDLFADMLTEVTQSKKSPQPSTQSQPLPQLESQVIPNLLPPPPPPPPPPAPEQSSQSVISPAPLPLSQSQQQQSKTQPQLQPQQATSSTTNNNEQQKAQNDLTLLGNNNNNPILSNMKRPVNQESIKSGSTSNSIQKSNNVNSPSKNQPKYLLNSFNWITLLERDHDMSVASVSSFRHCPMSQVWNSLITVGLKVEVKNRDVALPKSPRPKQDYYWIASVVKVSGYFVLLRFEGFDTDGTKDFWLNLFSNQLHPIGWCASQGKVLIPPRMIADKYSDWKAVLVKRLTGGRTLPENFFDQVKESMKSRFRVGMVLECVDKTRLSAVRVATIDKIIGNRLHLNYEGENEDNSGFWCHENSPLIHPIGWAQVVGHELKATQEYARSSLEKTIHKTFDDNDAYWSLFPVQRPHPTVNMADYRFTEGMKLEAIDPLNLSNICVATVTKVLRNHFLMVGIDGMMANDGSDWFCYHVLSPNIFPAGFCMLNNIPLTPPRGYNREFNWFEYLQETKSRAAPVHLFKKDIPVHGFKEGMLIEAVDLMVPRLICVATIIKVVGRLLKIHFNGWDETYDQWCDCESPELYPIGWCQMVGYPLEPPRESDAGDTHMTTYSSALDGRSKKRNIYKGRHKKRRRGGLNVSSSSDNSQVTLSNTNDRASTSDFMESFSSPYSPYNYDWSQQTGTSSSPPTSTSFANESNSSVIVKPSPVQPIIIQEPTSSNPSLTTTSSSKRSTDPRQWSVNDVCNFLRSKDHGNHVQSFARAQINGSRLLQLTTDEVLELTNKKLGPSLKIYALIQSLKGIKPQ
ncbi:MBT domain-containing protein 1-like [Panonychus citri]|uniref:MBT domain-containing protein 1-like n=1 Tax=Panonychus citri TaxID=50023 RepID=UPI0023075A18|nr:MBT domain-containing protein 1-like [Panonychus citri]